MILMNIHMILMNGDAPHIEPKAVIML